MILLPHPPQCWNSRYAPPCLLSMFLFFSLQSWSLNSGLHAPRQVLYHWSHSISPVFLNHTFAHENFVDQKYLVTYSKYYTQVLWPRVCAGSHERHASSPRNKAPWCLSKLCWLILRKEMKYRVPGGASWNLLIRVTKIMWGESYLSKYISLYLYITYAYMWVWIY
jgi:hypothetical protein